MTSLPDRPHHNFRISRSGHRQALHGLGAASKAVKGSSAEFERYTPKIGLHKPTQDYYAIYFFIAKQEKNVRYNLTQRFTTSESQNRTINEFLIVIVPKSCWTDFEAPIRFGREQNPMYKLE